MAQVGFIYSIKAVFVTTFTFAERNTTGYVEVTGADCQVRAHVLRPYDESRKYRDFNVLKVITDKTTKQVTHVAF